MKKYFSKFLKAFEITHQISRVSPDSGDIIDLIYYPCGSNKEKTQKIEGVVLSTKNSGTRESFMIHRASKGIKISQIFCLHSPNILEKKKKGAIKKKRSKLYFMEQIKKKLSLKNKNFK